MTILVVDDDPLFAKVCQRTLRGVVKYAYSLADGLKIAGEWQPSIVLLDARFPDGQRGVDAIGGLRERCPRAEIVVVTGLFNEDDARLAIARGAFTYLEKGDFLTLKAVTVSARQKVQTVFCAVSSRRQ